ncbi:aminotransferase class V-fold PLP-dependent enzyme [Erythrobacter litoralis]|nr:aminotransferase class V-fold PLP-dependent enzyme [Erythrobacter litoralis]
MPDRIYLDHAATSPLRPEARRAMEEGFALWANPSSPHAEGRKARAALEDARERIKEALGWDGELIFTSGASEAALLVFDSADVLNEVVSAVEHDCIHGFARDRGLVEIPADASGALDVEALDRLSVEPSHHARRHIENRRLVAIQDVNSETGNRQDIENYAECVHQNGSLIVVDCVQSAGKFSLSRNIDFALISAHKFGGPIGIGALLVKDYAMLKPSGGQERGYRRGTENLPGALGMAAALEDAGDPYVAFEILEPFDALADECRKLGGTWLSDGLSDPTPYIRAIAMPNMSATAQVMRFDMAGIAVSQGSACSSGTMKTSRVLEAMQVEPEIAANTIRVSVGWNTTRAEVERFCEVWLDLAKPR